MFLIVLTIRRGAVLFIANEKLFTTYFNNEKNNFFISNLCELFALSKNTELIHYLFNQIDENQINISPYSLIQNEYFTVSFCNSGTAEYLCEMYHQMLTIIKIKDSDIKNIYVSEGPGSFTGLRLGSAFVNGLNRGLKRNLFMIKSISLIQIYDLIKMTDLYFKYKNDFNFILEQKDESFAPVTLWDLLISIIDIINNTIKKTEEIIPVYGKEPEPVLKLKAEMLANK